MPTRTAAMRAAAHTSRCARPSVLAWHAAIAAIVGRIGPTLSHYQPTGQRAPRGNGAFFIQRFRRCVIFSLIMLTQRVALSEIPERKHLQPKGVLTGSKSAAN